MDVDSVNRFFERYGAALAQGDLDGIADAYAYPSLVLGGPDIILVRTRDDVKQAFSGAAERNRAEGFTHAVPQVDIIDDRGNGVTWVGVQWAYRSDDGSKQQLDAYRYLLCDNSANSANSANSDDGSDAITIVALTTAPTEEQ